MNGLLLGFALGAMAFTAQGREIGNKIGDIAAAQAKKVMANAKKPTEQPAGAVGDHSHIG